MGNGHCAGSSTHRKQVRAFSAVRGSDTLFPNDIAQDLFNVQYYIISVYVLSLSLYA